MSAINAQRLVNMTPEELEAYIQAQTADLSTEEAKEFEDKVTEKLEAYQEKLQDQIDQHQDVMKGLRRSKDASKDEKLAEAKKILKELEDELGQTEDVATSVEEANKEIQDQRALLNQDKSGDGAPTITKDNYKLDGETYTFNVGSGDGVSSDPWGGSAPSTDFDRYLKDENILDANGKLKTDKSYSDIESARTRWLEGKRVVTI